MLWNLDLSCEGKYLPKQQQTTRMLSSPLTIKETVTVEQVYLIIWMPLSAIPRRRPIRKATPVIPFTVALYSAGTVLQVSSWRAGAQIYKVKYRQSSKIAHKRGCQIAATRKRQRPEYRTEQITVFLGPYLCIIGLQQQVDTPLRRQQPKRVIPTALKFNSNLICRQQERKDSAANTPVKASTKYTRPKSRVGFRFSSFKPVKEMLFQCKVFPSISSLFMSEYKSSFIPPNIAQILIILTEAAYKVQFIVKTTQCTKNPANAAPIP